MLKRFPWIFVLSHDFSMSVYLSIYHDRLSTHTLLSNFAEMWQIFGISKIVRPFSLLVKRHKSGIFYVTGFADSIET